MRPALFTLLASATALAAAALWFRAGVWVAPGVAFPWLALGLGYGAVSLCGGAGLQLARRWSPKPSPASWPPPLELAVAVASLGAPALLESWEMPLALGLFALLVARLFKADRLDQLAALALVGADFAIEAVLVYRGAYAYRHAEVAPLPLWLPAVWANLALCGRRLFPLLPDRAARPGVA